MMIIPSCETVSLLYFEDTGFSPPSLCGSAICTGWGAAEFLPWLHPALLSIPSALSFRGLNHFSGFKYHIHGDNSQQTSAIPPSFLTTGSHSHVAISAEMSGSWHLNPTCVLALLPHLFPIACGLFLRQQLLPSRLPRLETRRHFVSLPCATIHSQLVRF